MRLDETLSSEMSKRPVVKAKPAHSPRIGANDESLGLTVLLDPASSSKDETTTGSLHAIDGNNVVTALVPEEDVWQFEVMKTCAKKQSDNAEYWSDKMKKDLVNAPHWSIENGFPLWQKVEDKRKRFQYCLNPKYSYQFLFFRAIQRHSGSTTNLALQDNVLLPKGFAECIYHVGNGKELRSIVNRGLTPEESVSEQADMLCSSLL